MSVCPVVDSRCTILGRHDNTYLQVFELLKKPESSRIAALRTNSGIVGIVASCGEPHNFLEVSRQWAGIHLEH